ncbi:MAG: beta-galactosidase [Nitrospira sp.]
MDVAVLRGDAPLFILYNNLVGPGWKGSRLTNLATVEGNTRVFQEEKIAFYADRAAKQPMPGRFDLRYELTQTGPSSIRIRYVCVPDSDTTFGFPKPEGGKSITIGPVLRREPYFEGGSCIFTFADGKTEQQPLPVPMSGRNNVASVTLKTAGGETIRMVFDPPLFIHCDRGELRCFSGNNVDVKAGQTFVQQITLELPNPVTFEPANRYVDMANWYPLNFEQAENFSEPSVLGMEEWLDKPAGKHGWLKIKGRDFVFEDGTPAKFWGVNQCWGNVCPPAEDAVKWADKWAKHGVNLVRMHKFVGHGWRHSGVHDKDDTLKLNEEMAKRWDRYHALLAERGIYVGWSPFYALKLTPADKDRVWAYDEIMRTTEGPPWYHASTVGLVNFAPDLQDLHIGVLKNLLNRVNTVTGKRYADDPALAYIEIQNEDDIFFGYRKLPQCPTYKKYLDRQFSKWLAAKYGSRDALAKAWGAQLKASESLEEGNVEAVLSFRELGGDSSPRIWDTYAFLYECQDAYYKRVVKAIRETGYQGAIVGSCWQAQTFLGHLYNLRSDREVGFIDRHNYGRTNMLSRPGWGLLSAGMQQVADRPFHLSEWAGGGVFRGMETVPVIGFVGMGVQGWDASSHFASDSPGISRKLGADVCDHFLSLAQYPAVARSIYRGDFVESPPVAVRRVSISAMASGNVGFHEEFSLLGGANIKEFSAVIPQEALAVGPVLLEFVQGPVTTPVEDQSAKWIDKANRRLVSASGQLKWDFSGRGWFTVDTPGTQAVVGFARGQVHKLTNVDIQLLSPVALLYISARQRNETIANATSLIITALGRLYPEGTLVDDLTMETIRQPEKVEAVRQLLEPVVAIVELKRPERCRVFALDHGGRKTNPPVELPVERTADGSRFTLDGTKYRTPFYVVEFERD